MSSLPSVLAYIGTFSIVAFPIILASGASLAIALPLAPIVGVVLFRCFYLPIPLRLWRKMATEFGVQHTMGVELRRQYTQPVVGGVQLDGLGILAEIRATRQGILIIKLWSPVANRLFQPLLIPWQRVIHIAIALRSTNSRSSQRLTATAELKDSPYPVIEVSWSSRFNWLIPDGVRVEDATRQTLARFRSDDPFES